MSVSAEEVNFTDTWSSTGSGFGSEASHAYCPACTTTGPRSMTDFSPLGPTLSECTSCVNKPNITGCYRFPPDAKERQHVPECIDPECAQDVCHECSDHEECCDDCVVDCTSDCTLSFGCDDLDVRVDDTYSLEGSHSELFGDQTAQTFGYGRRLPQLAMENTMTESGNLAKIPDDPTLSALAGYGVNQRYAGYRLQQLDTSFQGPQPPRKQLSSLEATTPNISGYESDFHALPTYELAPSDTSALARDSPSLIYSSDSTHNSPDLIDSTPNAYYDHINLLTEKSDSARSFPPSLQCQWADPNGRPCENTLTLGSDLHEHLKSTHGVRNEVFCRWVGCSAGVLEASPHRFANSVERHTWGHSGYRPYKCSVCNEGFAAANVRDEHFTNIHLRKKVFSCDACSHQCTSVTNLKRHKDDKHSAERFQCEFCNRYGKRRLFPRGPNLARHFRNCKYVLGQFPEATAAGKVKGDWLPPGYRRGHHGMDRAKVTPPKCLSAPNDA